MNTDDYGNHRRKGRPMIDTLEAAPPVTTGRPIPNFPLLTDAIGGLRGITVLGAPTKVGKSTLAANIVANVGGPRLPVLYLDLENDEGPEPRAVGDWIADAYGRTCPALRTLYGYNAFDDLKSDLPTFPAPALVVVDTAQAVVGQAGERMRVEMVGLVEWAKEQVRRGYLVLLLSQINGGGAYKESGALAEGGWTNLNLARRSADEVHVKILHRRFGIVTTPTVVLHQTGKRLVEVSAVGGQPRTESGVKLTPIQRAIVKHGGRISFENLMRARGYSLKRDSAPRKRGLREIAAAVEAREIGHPERGVYVFPTSGEDKVGDNVSSASVPGPQRATSQEHEADAA